MADSDQDAAYSDDDFGSEEGEYEGGYEEESHAGVEIKEDPTEPAADVRGLGEEDAGTELKPTDSGATISQTTITDLDRPLEEVNEGSRLGTEDDSTTKVRAADGAVPSSRPGESTPGRQADDAYTPTEAATIPAATTTTTCTGVEDPSELPSSDTEESAETQDVCGAMNATQKVPSMLGRSNTLRSLSVPAVQAPSLVDPRLLVPSNQRSTSVLVPNSQNLSINHQDSGHFRIETRLNVSSPRTKSFTRLPSVEEFESQDTVASSTDSEGEDSETDALDGSRELTLSEDESLSSNGRGSSFRDLIPKVSPVWQSSSQAFLPHLPSVIEVTAEEIAAIENTRDGGRNDAEEEKSEGTSENELAPELIGSAERVDGNETSPRDDTQWISNTGENIGFLPNLIDHTPGPAIASANCMGEENRSEGKRTVIDECVNVLLPNGESAPDSAEQDAGSSYEYDYEEQTTASNSGEDAAVPAKGETVPFLTSDFDDELPPAEENKDDEYEEDNDDYMDVHFEEDNRRETELLLREAQLLIQKQYNQDTVHLSPIKETHNMEPGDTEEVAALIQLIRMGNQEFTDNAEEFEDQYGGDEDFMDGEEDEEEEEFEQYASDGDDVGDDDAIYLTPSSERSDPPSCKETASVEDHQVESVESNIVATAIVDNASTPSDNAEPPVTDTVAQISVVDEAKVLRSEESAADRHEPTATSESIEPVNEKKTADSSKFEKLPTQSSPQTQSSSIKRAAGADSVAKHPVASRPKRPAPANVPHTEARAGVRASRPVAVEKDKRVPESPARSPTLKEIALTRERPRELRLKTMRSTVQQSTATATATATVSFVNMKQASPRPTRTKSDSGIAVEKKEEEIRDPEASLTAENSSSSLATEFTHVAMVRPRSPPKSPGRAPGAPSQSPEKVSAYTPRVYVEEYELPLRKAPVFKQQKRTKKTLRPEESRHKLTPVKGPPNLRIDLPNMDKTKRDWLFLNMFRHGDDISKYESFVLKLVTAAPSKPTSRDLHRPYSAHMSCASSQEDGIYAYGGGRHSRSGRRLVQQDSALRERERNWAPIKPHESAIPPYDSILDKFCATVTSPVIQRQIYHTRLNDLSPQLAYVLEKRVENNGNKQELLRHSELSVPRTKQISSHRLPTPT